MREFLVTEAVREYAVAHGSRQPDDVVRRLRSSTAELGHVSGMQIGDDQGQLLTLLTRLVGARRAVEVGTFTGYSSLCIARGLAEGGSLLCCDVSAEWTAIGRVAWRSAGLDDRIELVIAPAIDTLRSLPDGPRLDLVFIDANKPGYVDYWAAWCPGSAPAVCCWPTTPCGAAPSSPTTPSTTTRGPSGRSTTSWPGTTVSRPSS